MINLLCGLGDLLREADAARESGNLKSPAARFVAALPADLLVILRTIADEADGLTGELATWDGQLNPIDPACPFRLVTHFLLIMQELHVLGIAGGVVCRAFFDAVKADAQARDLATAALLAGSAKREKDGRVVLRVVPDNA
jgi:hypothetical protein